MRGTWRKGSFIGATKALEMGVFFHKGPVLGNMGVCFLSRPFERRVKYLLSELI